MVETDLTGNNPTEYVFFSGKRVARRNADGSVNYYLADHLGSTRTIASSAGSPLYHADFLPFGGEVVIYDYLGTNSYKFTGKERDTETQNDYFGAIQAGVDRNYDWMERIFAGIIDRSLAAS